MKRIIAPIALSLLAISTPATADDKVSYDLSKLYSDRTATELADRINNRKEYVNDRTCRYDYRLSDYECFESDSTKSTTKSNSDLQVWTSAYYRNFKEHEMFFTTVDDCFIALDFMITDIRAQRIFFDTIPRNEYRYNLQYIGWKFTNNEETRIECSSRYSTRGNKKEYVLTYKTAYKLTAEELAIEDKKWREQLIESQRNHKENIESQVNEFLNIIKK